MEVNIRLPIYCLVLGLLAGYWITKTYMPRVETKTVEVAHDVVRNNVITHTIIKAPDGSTTTTDTTDNSTRVVDTKSSETMQIFNVPQWRVGALTSGPGLYSAMIERRLLGPFSLALTANTQNQFNLGVTYEF